MNAVPYEAAREAAKQWLGDRYLLAKPINQKPRAVISRENIKACLDALRRAQLAS